MTKKNAPLNRLLSILLCLALLMSYLPATSLVAEAADDPRVTDPHTLNQWNQFFGAQADGSLSTEFAGGVWTDKSVFTSLPDELKNALYNGAGINFQSQGDNFLVALSAMAANKEIVGYETVPTDTVFVLDLSSSMRSGSGLDNITPLADATNEAIKELMALNKNNRVAVVLYSGADNGNQSVGTATQILLPLDHYTSGNNGNYIQATGSGSSLGIRVTSGVRNSSNTTVSGSRAWSSGTYTQDGIYQAMKILLNADTEIQSGVQGGTQRMPIMVLMSDGEPSVYSQNYYGSGNPDHLEADFRDGAVSTYVGTGSEFMVQLTAAYAKYMIDQHYKEHDLLFYSLGLGGQYAFDTTVLDPASNTDTDSYWSRYLANQSITLNFERYSEHHDYTPAITNNAGILPEFKEALTNSANNTTKGQNKYRYYVDQYFTSEDGTGLNAAFDAIVREIQLQSKYYPTYLDQYDLNHDGYLVFSDKIGSYMEITDIKGIVIGDRLFSGAAMAQAFTNNSFGSETNPTDMGNDLVWSVMARLNIDNLATARTLISNAYAYGQFSYTSDTQFSHYIGWFSDASGNYIDFWHEGMTQEDIDAAKAKGATHIIKSYGFLGSTDQVHGIDASDMMYMSVRVSREIEDNDNMITWQIPAALIPTLTYKIGVTVNDDGTVRDVTSLDLEAGTADSPIRLVYEAALRSDIQDWNITEKVDKAYVDSTTNKLAGYTFYTNKWTVEARDTDLNTYSYFRPSVQNERYYYPADSLICIDDQGTPYTGDTAPTGASYYRRYHIYTKSATGALHRESRYEKITEVSIGKAERKTDGTWIIPKGTVFRIVDDLYMAKTENATGTMGHSDSPFVVTAADGTYYTYSTQGNNGRLTVTPATGIKLTKTLQTRVDGAGDSFVFTIGGGNLTNAQIIRLDAEGNEASRTALPANGKITLAANETVYIIGLTAGAAYTVTEEFHTDYVVASITGGTVSGSTTTVTAVDQTIQAVEFLNQPKGYGSLSIGKDVMYPQGFDPTAAHDAKEFEIAVTFVGNDLDLDKIQLAGNTDPNYNVDHLHETVKGNGLVTYILHLRDSDSVTFINIAEGVKYSVAENGLVESTTVTHPMPYGGYVHTDTVYYTTPQTIVADTTQHAQVVNTYNPAGVTPNIIVSGTKTVLDTWTTTGPLAQKKFMFRLLQVDSMADDTPTVLAEYAVDVNNHNYSFDLGNYVTFDTAGMYYFRIVEVSDTASLGEEFQIDNMRYDQSIGLFTVEVGDTDADGSLEVIHVTGTAVDSVIEAPTTGADYEVVKNFTNYKQADLVSIPVQKRIDSDAATLPEGIMANIRFGLFANLTDTEPVHAGLTGADGAATIGFAVTAQQLAAADGAIIYYLREIAPAMENRVVGMTYNEDWQYAIRITAVTGTGKATVEYAATNAAGAITSTWSALPESGFAFEITNTYDDSVVSTPDIILSGDKILNRPAGSTAGGSFTFEIYQTGANFVIAENAIPLQTTSATIGADGKAAIKFDAINFDAVGTYYLVIQEQGRHTATGPITYDDSRYTVTVHVEKYKDEDPASASYGKTLLRVRGTPLIQKIGATTSLRPDDIDFTNTYTIPGTGSAVISGTKELTGKHLTAGEFTFVLTEMLPDGNGGYQVLAGGLELTVPSGISTDNHTVGFHFPEITYDSSDLGHHYYRVTERNDGVRGVGYDPTAYIVQITVTDNGDGTLTVSQPEVVGGGSIVFRNTYTPDPVYFNLGVSKDFEDKNGVELNLDRVFQFSIVETGADFTTPLTGGLNKVLDMSSTTGKYAAEELKFEAPGVRYFVIREVVPAGAENGTLNGVVYDTTEYHVTVTCVNNETQGRLVVSSTTQAVDAGPDGPVYTVVGHQTFYNRYVTTDTELTISGNKNLVGDTLTAGQFTFELYQGGTLIDTAANALDGSFSFQKLTFSYDDIGEHHYVIKEFVPAGATDNKLDGVTYDTRVYELTVTVSDNGDGTLQATYAVEGTTDNSIIFRNTYTVDGSATVTINGNKTFTGSAVANPSFTFELYQTDGDYIIDSAAVLKEFLTKPAGDFTFLLNYTKDDLGVYHYVLREKNTGLSYIQYDTKEYHFQITVSDLAGNVVVKVEPVTEGLSVNAAEAATAVTLSGAQFTNRYIFTDTGSATISGNKELTGKDMTDGEFSFKLEEVVPGSAGGYTLVSGGLSHTVSNVGAAFTFPAIYYTGEDLGDHYYRITEVKGSDNKVKYDEAVYIVKITVTDDGDGTLTVSQPTIVSGGTALVFRNTYTPSSVSTTLEIEKLLQNEAGQKMDLSNDAFSFIIQETQSNFTTLIGTAQRIYINAEGKAVSGEIKFDWNHETGAYSRYFVIKEVVPAGAQNNVYNGVTYDTTEYHVTIQCANDTANGVLVLTKTIVKAYATETENQILFVNHYATADGELTLSGTKELENANLIAGQFSFQMYNSDAQWNQGTPVGNAAWNRADGGFDLPTLTYSDGDIGTHYYLIREVNGGQSINGITYDSTVYRVTVEVTDNGNGQLLTSVKMTDQYGNSVDKIAFVNEYNITGSSFVEIDGTKNLGGREMADNEFTFVLYQTGSDFVPGNTPLKTASNVNKAFSFRLEYVAADAGKTFYYVVKEMNAGKIIHGVAHSTEEYRITVTVEDDGVGGIKTTTVINKGEQSVQTLEFTNTYTAAQTEVAVSGEKTLEGRELKADEFSFEVYSANESFAIHGTALQTVKNKADGSFVFASIALTEAKTYFFVVKENSQNPLGGVDYDHAEYHITVVVEDNGQGSLEVKSNTMVRVDDGKTEAAQKIAFTNIYDANSTTVNLEAKKVLTGRELAAGEFDFVLQQTDSSFAPLAGTTPMQDVNQADGTVVFDALTFHAAGIYYYIVYEEASSDVERVTFDPTVYQITIEVKDNGAGQLVAEKPVITKKGSTTQVDSIVFNNVFTPKPDDITVQMAVNKIVINKGFNKIGPEGFQFLLENTATGEKKTMTVNAEGFAAVSMTYTEKDIGKTYTYKLSEINDGKANVTYSDKVYTIAVTISLSQDNKLVAELKMDNALVEKIEAAFENTYDFTPDPGQVSVNIAVNKIVENLGFNKIGPEGFQFLLENAATGEKKTLTTNEAGKAAIELIFQKADVGTNTFKLYEVNDGKANVTYSDKIYTIDVIVSVNENNELVAQLKVDGTEVDTITAEFKNTYDYTPDPDALNVSVAVDKIVVNKGTMQITPEGFQFLLENLETGKKQTVKADAKGAALFNLTFTGDDAGKTHVFQLTEINDGRSYVTYSDKIYTIEIAVSVDKNNELVAQVQVNELAVEQIAVRFENIYDFTPDNNPDTGDTYLFMWVALLFVSGGCFAALNFFGKKKEEEQI